MRLSLLFNRMSLAVFAGLIAAVAFFSYQSPTPIASYGHGLPDAYLENVTARFMDAQGRLHVKMETPQMLHYATDDITQLTQPAITFYRKSPQPWYITAQHATAIHGMKLVQFSDDVIIHRAADGSNPATLIKTPRLLVHPKEHVAETTEAITMLQPGLKVSATGMYADMSNGNIKLLSQSRGEYVPDTRS